METLKQPVFLTRNVTKEVIFLHLKLKIF